MIVREGPSEDESEIRRTLGQPFATERERDSQADRRPSGLVAFDAPDAAAYLDNIQAITKLGLFELNVAEGLVRFSPELYRMIDLDPKSGPMKVDGVFEQVIHPDDREPMRQIVERTLTEKNSYVTECRLVRADGTSVIVEARGGATIDEHGSVTRIIGTVQDISQRKADVEQLRQQAELLRIVMDNLPDMVCVLSPEGRVIYVNREWDRILGWSYDDSLGRDDIIQMLYPDDAESRRVFEFIDSGTDEWREFTPRTKSGKRVETRWFNVRLSDGRVISIGTDLSDEKAAERANHKLRETLESRIESTMASKGTQLGLTFRELTVLSLVAMGKQDKEIAEILGIGRRTIESHVSNILAKMSATSRTEATVKALKSGFIPADW